MRLHTLIRFIAAILVLTVVVMTLFAVSKHFNLISGDSSDELAGKERIDNLLAQNSEEDELVIIDKVRRKLNSKTNPEIILGNPAFERARSLLQAGDFENARLKLEEIVARYPGTPAEREAYRVLGEMRLDDLLEHRPDDGKFIYKVVPNDSYLKIVKKHDTKLDMLLYLNGLTRLDRLRPEDELVIMPLNLSLRIIPRLNQLFLIDEQGNIIKSYEPTIDMSIPKKSGGGSKVETTIENVFAYRGRTKISVTRDDYRSASKKISILDPKLEIISNENKVEKSFRGIVLKKLDIEELALLLRRGNNVEIHY